MSLIWHLPAVNHHPAEAFGNVILFAFWPLASGFIFWLELYLKALGSD